MTDNTHPQPTVGTTVKAAVTDFFRPVEAPSGSTEHKLLVARQLVVGVGAVATVAQIVVWMLAAIIGGHVDGPWWLWSAVLPVLLLLGGLTAAARTAHDVGAGDNVRAQQGSK